MIDVKVSGGLVEITLNRPDKANALTQDMLADLIAAVTAHGPKAHAMVLTGANARDPHVKAAFGLEGQDEIVGFIYIGTPSGPTFEKDRPDPADFTTTW